MVNKAEGIVRTRHATEDTSTPIAYVRDDENSIQMPQQQQVLAQKRN